MILDSDAIRENIQYSPFTKRVTTTPQKGLSQRAEGVLFITRGGISGEQLKASGEGYFRTGRGTIPGRVGPRG